jgi:hypothetical protein
MTATVQPESKSSSRRALLAGALGGLGAWAASAIGRAAPAEAAVGDPIRMGRTNYADGTSTALQTTAKYQTLLVRQRGDGAALRAESESGRAVTARATTGIAVDARAYGRPAVKAEVRGGPAVYAISANGTAVLAGGGTIGVDTYGPEIGLRATSGSVAAYFTGRVFHLGTYDLSEIIDAAAPGNAARLFARNNGSGKTQLCVRFKSGAVQVIATEP